MRKAYRELFDEVHASERLRTEVRNIMKNTTNRNTTRRIPAAALLAAVLVIALGGTALAYLSRVTVTPYGDGYSIQAETGNIPLTSLSENVLQRAANADRRADILPFQSWDEAEAYLGLEIADNATLDQMEKGLWGISLNESEKPVVAPSIMDLRYNNGLPDSITLIASYIEGDFSIKEEAVLMVEDPAFDEDRTYHFANPIAELNGTETYVTPSGIAVTIITSRAVYREDFIRTEYHAQFVLNHASFCVRIGVDEGKSSEDALVLLKEILDAYE